MGNPAMTIAAQADVMSTNEKKEEAIDSGMAAVLQYL
jgi:hypothetical protein